MMGYVIFKKGLYSISIYHHAIFIICYEEAKTRLVFLFFLMQFFHMYLQIQNEMFKNLVLFLRFIYSIAMYLCGTIILVPIIMSS